MRQAKAIGDMLGTLLRGGYRVFRVIGFRVIGFRVIGFRVLGFRVIGG